MIKGLLLRAFSALLLGLTPAVSYGQSAVANPPNSTAVNPTQTSNSLSTTPNPNAIRPVIHSGYGLGTTPTLRVITNGTAFSPLVTFTRASTANDVNSSGVLTSFSSGTPRFGYDPVTLVPLGYLSEEQRTNLALRSQDFADASWQVFAGAAKVGIAGSPAPDGTSTAYELSFGATGGSLNAASAVYRSQSVAVSTAYALTYYVRAKTGSTTIRIAYGDTGYGGQTGTADITVTTTWTRVPFVFSSINGTSAVIGIFNNAAGNSGNVYIWGAQLEATSTNYPGPTSYIPTTSATVTRAPDVASITGSNFSGFYNQAAGTWGLNLTWPGDYNQLAVPLAAINVDSTNAHVLVKDNSSDSAAGKRWNFYTTVGGGKTAIFTTGADAASGNDTAGYSYAVNNFAAQVNRTLLGTDNSGALPSPTRLDIGEYAGINYWCNCHILKLDYYRSVVRSSKFLQLPLLDLPRIPANDDQPERMAA